MLASEGLHSSAGYPIVECIGFFTVSFTGLSYITVCVCVCVSARKSKEDNRAKKRCLLLCSAQLLRPTVPTNDKCANAANWQPAALDVAQPPTSTMPSLLDRQQQLLCRQTQSLNDRLNDSVNKWMNQCEPRPSLPLPTPAPAPAPPPSSPLPSPPPSTLSMW